MDHKVKANWRRLVDGQGRKVRALNIHVPQDHPQVKRYPLTHQYMKAFYLSTSAGSINNSRNWRLDQFLVVDTGSKISAVDRQVANFWKLNTSASAGAA